MIIAAPPPMVTLSVTLVPLVTDLVGAAGDVVRRRGARLVGVDALEARAIRAVHDGRPWTIFVGMRKALQCACRMQDAYLHSRAVTKIWRHTMPTSLN